MNAAETGTSLPMKNSAYSASIIVLFITLFLPIAKGEEPVIETLLANSPLIVVATATSEDGNLALGEASEVVLVKYSVKFKVNAVLKSENSVKPGDTILTRLALRADFGGAEAFRPDPAKKTKILFLRKTDYEKDSFQNTSLWLGVMEHTAARQAELEYTLREMARKP